MMKWIISYDELNILVPVSYTHLMSQFDDTEILVKSLGIEAKVEDMSMEEILDIYRDNVCFYYRNINDAFEYAHITFLELDDDHQAITTEMSDISSGVVMLSLIHI